MDTGRCATIRLLESGIGTLRVRRKASTSDAVGLCPGSHAWHLLAAHCGSGSNQRLRLWQRWAGK